MTRQKHRSLTLRSGVLALTAASMLLTACANDPSASSAKAGVIPSGLMPRQAASAPAPVSIAPDSDKESTKTEIDKIKMALGSGRTFRVPQAAAATPADPSALVTLTFENGDVREIVKNLLGDLLNESFIIDPAVTGTVTIRTASGIRKSDVIPTLETLLRSVRAVLVRDGTYWRVLPEAGANLGTSPPRVQLRAGGGSSVVILPVKFIGAKELERVLLPFAKAGTPPPIRVDELRNLLFLSGTEAEIRNLLEIAEMFDVNLMSGMSFLLYPLESSDVKTVSADWEKIFPAAANPFAGLLRVVPIERMNALLLISPQRDVIVDARQWLERLDKGSDAGGGARLYVYNVQYTQAEKLQATLQQAITGRVAPATPASVAPGQTANTLSAPVTPIAGQPLITPGNTLTNPQQAAQRQVAATPAGAANQALGLARNATVIADKDRNALLIVATPAEYSAIESAIKKLDTPPKMIAIEVQIAQVALDGAFQFGISGMFTGKPESAANRLTSEGGIGALNPAGADGKIVPGFSYTWQGAAAKAILSTLQTTGQSRTLASPTLMTLDNQKVSFSNGTQISVQTQTSVATGTTSATNSYQYIPTGLTINITPRVSGNNVFLDIQQENSTAGAIRADNPNPDITKNSQQSTVMVANGDTMLLSGLFVDSGSRSTNGFPVLSTIPILGGIFGSQNWNSNRSELVMLVTPRVMSTVEESRGVVDELRQRMSGIEQLLPQVSTKELPASSEARKAAQDRRNAERIPSEFNQSLKVAPEGNR
jgi:general secretion pathway protein D